MTDHLRAPLGVLRVDEDELAACVSCGLCLPHCPTYRVTGDESASPRGRISAMRAIHAGHEPLGGPTFTEFMDLCVQCRACEVACPSAVPFGRLMEGARETLASQTSYQPAWKRLGYRLLEHHRLLVTLTALGALLQRAGLLPSARLGLPTLPMRQERLVPTGDDVWLFTGCVMDAWSRPTHAATKRVIEATGAGVALPGPGAACCGALHAHAGLADRARRLARRVMRSMPGDAPIVVDSAGCGAALKEYGHLLGTDDAASFASRVVDASEWLADHLDALPPAAVERVGTVAVHDACHLRNVQRAHEHTRTVLRPFARLVELDDEGLCCGAGGAYAGQHPEMAAAIRQRKLEAIERSGASLVSSGNPGCSMHLAAAGVAVRHPMEIIDDALRGTDGR